MLFFELRCRNGSVGWAVNLKYVGAAILGGNKIETVDADIAVKSLVAFSGMLVIYNVVFFKLGAENKHTVACAVYVHI